MNSILQAFALAVVLGGFGGLPVAGGEDDPAARWLSVYAWIQTSEQLAAVDQWPLALGSSLEANRLLTALASDHPTFEPEMIAYRREALAKTIAETETRLTTDEHEVMMKYLDFIESLELGEAQRYQNDFPAALATLAMAKSLLDEIIAIKPATFRDAVASQSRRLESGIAWLDSQVNIRVRNLPKTILDETVDWGTTRFVKEGDLPRDLSTAPVSLALFPPSVAMALAAAHQESGEAPMAESSPSTTATTASGGRRFRMSSRKSAVPNAGETVAR
mgnify:CR=1 FL=1